MSDTFGDFMIGEVVKLRGEKERTFKAGYAAGYRRGYTEALDAARKIVDDHFPVPVAALCEGGRWEQEPDESRRYCSKCSKYEHEHPLQQSNG